MSAPDLLADRFVTAIEAAKTDPRDDEVYWSAIQALQSSDVSTVWAAVTPLARDEDARLRALVPDVLRYLGGSPQPRLDETLDLFRQMLRDEAAPGVIAAIGTAFVDIDHPAAVDLMVPFAIHDDARVRSAVVHALLGKRAGAAVDALIELSRDVDARVRNWAAFGLGSMLGEPSEEAYFDSEPLRSALVARLDDEDEDTRLGAIEGLAMRKDARALPSLERALSAEKVSPVAIDAAYAMASPTMLAALERLAMRDESTLAELERAHHSLREAIVACAPPREQPE